MHTSLKSLQKEFLDYVFHGKTAILSHIQKPSKQTAQQRMNIYRNGYYERLIESIAQDYPVFKKIMGDAIFRKLAIQYIQKCPSRSYSLAPFCERFFQFVSKNKTLEREHHEIAQFEFLLERALVAPNTGVLSLNTLSQIPQDQWSALQFSLHPSVQLIKFSFNTPEVWQAYTQNKKIRFKKNKVPQYYLIWRHALTNHFMPLSSVGVRLIQAIQKKKGFGNICASIVQNSKDITLMQQIAGLIHTWVERGVLTEGKVPERKRR